MIVYVYRKTCKNYWQQVFNKILKWKIIGAYTVKRKGQLVDKYLEAKEMTFPDKFGSISQIAGTVRTHHLRMGRSYKQTRDHRNLVRIPDIRQTKGQNISESLTSNINLYVLVYHAYRYLYHINVLMYHHDKVNGYITENFLFQNT